MNPFEEIVLKHMKKGLKRKDAERAAFKEAAPKKPKK